MFPGHPASANAPPTAGRATPSSLFVIAYDVRWMGVRFVLGAEGLCADGGPAFPDDFRRRRLRRAVSSPPSPAGPIGEPASSPATVYYIA